MPKSSQVKNCPPGYMEALKFVHAHGIYHRDIKPVNILLCRPFSSPSGFDAKMSDFGLAKIKEAAGGSSSAGVSVGTCAYMAPEVLDNDGDPSDDEGAGASGAAEGGVSRTDWFKVDVFAFGVVVYEIFARREPFKGLSIVKIVKRVVMEEERPGEIPASASKSIREVIERAWKQKPSDRPHMVDINDVLLAEVDRVGGGSGGGGSSNGGTSLASYP